MRRQTRLTCQKLGRPNPTLSRVCAELERTYGLTVVEGREGGGMPGLTRAELEQTAQHSHPSTRSGSEGDGRGALVVVRGLFAP